MGGEEGDGGFASMCLAFDQSSNRGVIGSSNNIIATFSMENDYTLNQLGTTSITNPGISALTFRGDNKVSTANGS